ncbi:uncharacterized protein LOC114871704 isoform X2 [Osmia bicornis bicornis]|uniref:uncharacterized protein LOC114871704 isoform X2 n=2 Tax=Osmia bicornis bicornis TaxID=1437191 RepID=UPI0010F7A558|nr:uncharacterized protein LOC114871704 isoform X2 [Osmia bicornis bicornis]XP_029033761.1 uncharacterized protein LOC114871704 isoform X2 [Osmia bicornis bicornis]XP_029033762.1 uncharacterized protein LOC114871704 isoform X2 [Osmia bicornis bicornis]XP_029033763.1 uncharacterized protein LOC114871704 isoform X2 [Osmia bicornis bicornis]
MKRSTEELDDFATGMDFEWRTELGCLRAMDPESIVLFREEGRRTNVYEEAAGNSFILGFVQGFTDDVSWRKAVV